MESPSINYDKDEDVIKMRANAKLLLKEWAQLELTGVLQVCSKCSTVRNSQGFPFFCRRSWQVGFHRQEKHFKLNF